MHNVLALVSFKIYPAEMGGQKGVAFFYRFLEQHFKITIAATKNNVRNDIEKCLYPNRLIFLNFFRIRRLKKIITDKKIDLIIAEHSYTGWLARLLSKRTGKPFIIHSHNIEALRFRQMQRWWWKWYWKYERIIHRKADHSFFISKEDRDYALDNFGLDPDRCSVITYGVEFDTIPEDTQNIRQQSGLEEDMPLFFFNGTLDYQPNMDAVILLLEKIDPLLRKQLNKYKILIAGRNASSGLIQKIEQNDNFIYKGFVEKIETYYGAATLFLNPITNNSGIKTKLVEAIAHNCTVVSFEGGAAGIEKEVCGEKLLTVPDHDHEKFATLIKINSGKEQPFTPAAFYETYYWANIATKAAVVIDKAIQKK
jgi:glycosyltransferase involved in cell wall biosynthesis